MFGSTKVKDVLLLVNVKFGMFTVVGSVVQSVFVLTGGFTSQTMAPKFPAEAKFTS